MTGSIGTMRAWAMAGLLTGMVAMAVPAAAQDVAPDPGPVTVTGGYDFLNQYMFRGIRQNSTGIAMWPWADVGVAAYSGDGALKSVGVNVGMWNSVHTDSGGGSAAWYEADYYGTVSLGFSAATLATTYTSYTSPDDLFTHVKEVMFKVTAAADRTAGFSPYAAVAFELATEPGRGQADGGLEAGRYLELGVAPSLPVGLATLSIPVKVGLSLSNYYELEGEDNKFGFASVGGLVTVPVASTGWNVHGGVELQGLGKTTKFFNDGDSTQVIGSIGFGFSY